MANVMCPSQIGIAQVPVRPKDAGRFVMIRHQQMRVHNEQQVAYRSRGINMHGLKMRLGDGN